MIFYFSGKCTFFSRSVHACDNVACNVTYIWKNIRKQTVIIAYAKQVNQSISETVNQSITCHRDKNDLNLNM